MSDIKSSRLKEIPHPKRIPILGNVAQFKNKGSITALADIADEDKAKLTEAEVVEAEPA